MCDACSPYIRKGTDSDPLSETDTCQCPRGHTPGRAQFRTHRRVLSNSPSPGPPCRLRALRSPTRHEMRPATRENPSTFTAWPSDLISSVSEKRNATQLTPTAERALPGLERISESSSPGADLLDHHPGLKKSLREIEALSRSPRHSLHASCAPLPTEMRRLRVSFAIPFRTSQPIHEYLQFTQHIGGTIPPPRTYPSPGRRIAPCGMRFGRQRSGPIHHHLRTRHRQ